MKKSGQGKLKVCHIFLLYGEQKIAETQVLLSKIPAPACSLQADPPIERQRTDVSVCRFSPEWEARKKKQESLQWMKRRVTRRTLRF